MKIKDIRKKSEKDLEKEVAKLREAIAKAEFEKFSTDDKDVKKQRNQRRDLARMLTVLNEDTDETSTKEVPTDKKEDK